MKISGFQRLESVVVRTCVLLLVVGVMTGGCRKKKEVVSPGNQDIVESKIESDIDSSHSTAQVNNTEDDLPVVGDSEGSQPAAEIKRIEVDSPFEQDYESPVPKEPKKLWARSVLWQEAPELVVENWLTDEPETKGKFLLIEFWATWCGPCRKAVPKLNELHKKFGDRLTVIGISDEKGNTVQKFAEENIDYYVAVDTNAVMKKQLNVVGIPHVIIVEPGGYVIWEGFPLLKGYELTEEVITKILIAGDSEDSKV